MKLTLTLDERELTAAIANGSLVAFIANAGLEADFQADLEPEPQPKAHDAMETYPSLEETRAELMKLQETHRDLLVAKINEYGGTLSDIDPSKRPELIAWAKGVK